MGTPTPGTVPEPAKNMPGQPPLHVARGRNGPVWGKVCASANGVPAAMPWPASPAGVTSSSVTMSVG